MLVKFKLDEQTKAVGPFRLGYRDSSDDVNTCHVIIDESYDLNTMITSTIQTTIPDDATHCIIYNTTGGACTHNALELETQYLLANTEVQANPVYCPGINEVSNNSFIPPTTTYGYTISDVYDNVTIACSSSPYMAAYTDERIRDNYQPGTHIYNSSLTGYLPAGIYKVFNESNGYNNIAIYVSPIKGEIYSSEVCT